MFKDRTVLYGMAEFADVDILSIIEPGVPFDYWQKLDPTVQSLKELTFYFEPFLSKALDDAYAEMKGSTDLVWLTLAKSVNSAFSKYENSISAKLMNTYPVTGLFFSFLLKQATLSTGGAFRGLSDKSYELCYETTDRLFKHPFFVALIEEDGKPQRKFMTLARSVFDDSAVAFHASPLIGKDNFIDHKEWSVTMNNLNWLKKGLSI